MNFFEFLLVGHLAGDFMFQTSWMAGEKTKNIVALSIHSAVYTFFTGLAAVLAGKFSWPIPLILFFSHMLLDNRKFVSFWVKNINGAGDVLWLNVVGDQCWHIIVLAFIACVFG